jgi:hypothetical protein
LNTANQAMYGLGLDLIELQRSQSSSEWLKAGDALLGRREVKLENLAEAMRDKLEAARFKQVMPEELPCLVSSGKDASTAPGK